MVFIGRFKVEIIPEVINKEVFAQFIYKPAQSTGNCLPRKVSKFVTLCVLKERGRVKAQVPFANC